MSAITTMKVCGEVMDERRRQDTKWGPSNERSTPGLCVLVEEVGEVAKDICEARACEAGALFGPQEAADEYAARVAGIRTELIQVAAVAVAMVEGIDRGDVPLR